MAQAGTQGDIGTQAAQDLMKLASIAGLGQLNLRPSRWELKKVSSTFAVSGGADVTADVGNIFISAFNTGLGQWALCKGVGAGFGVGVGVSRIKGIKVGAPVSVSGKDFKRAARLAQFDISRFLPSGNSQLFLGPAGASDAAARLFSGCATFYDASAAAGLLGGGIGYGISIFALSDVPLIITPNAAGVPLLRSAAFRLVKAFALVYGGEAPIIPAAGAGVDETVYRISVHTQPGTADNPPTWGA